MQFYHNFDHGKHNTFLLPIATSKRNHALLPRYSLRFVRSEAYIYYCVLFRTGEKYLPLIIVFLDIEVIGGLSTLQNRRLKIIRELLKRFLVAFKRPAMRRRCLSDSTRSTPYENGSTFSQ